MPSFGACLNKAGKRFFFEKKKQKTFAPEGPSSLRLPFHPGSALSASPSNKPGSLVPHRRRPAAPWLLLLALLPGCRLVDQRTFDASAGRPPAPPPAAPAVAAAATPPLLTIRYDVPAPDYAAALRVAVRRALDRKPDVLFEVVTLVPARGTPAEQVAAAQTGSASGREVAQGIVEDGADVGQVEMAARADPALTAKEVRIYVH